MPDDPARNISAPQKVEFLSRLRDARARVLRDAESFHEASTVLEHIGQVLTQRLGNGLGAYEKRVTDLAVSSGNIAPDEVRRLFRVVREARNSAVHDGAYVRHLSSRLVDLLLILEEAIMKDMQRVGDLMVRDPVVAEPWHLVSQVRRTMLAHSFSYIPILLDHGGEKKWRILTDSAVMKVIRKASGRDERNRILGTCLEDAIKKEGLRVEDGECRRPEDLVGDLVDCVGNKPVLVFEAAYRDPITGSDRLVGIITAFDLL